MKKRNRNILIGASLLFLLILMPWGPSNSSNDTGDNATTTVSNDSEPAKKTVEKSSDNAESSDNPKEPKIPNKYNKLIQNVSGDLVWETDTCPLCGAKDAEAQAETNKLISNVCWKCGYEFYQQKPIY